MISTFQSDYVGECYTCREFADVQIDYDTPGNVQLCERCWDSAGRQAAIEAEQEGGAS